MQAPVSCPYCASLLEPPPKATGRCSHCRQRIVVRQVDDRAVYLAESVLPFFEAERRRVAESKRCAQERDEWLTLARKAGATTVELKHANPEYVTKADVAAARAVYTTAIDRSVQAARGARRWEDAAMLRYEQARILAGNITSADPLPEDVLRVHRDGVAADLEAIGEVARSAELHGTSCCDACRSDEGRVAPIEEQLREPVLPHPGCRTGVCRCRWFLSRQDRTAIGDFVRRQEEAYRRLG